MNRFARIFTLLLALIAPQAFSQTAPTVSTPSSAPGANGAATLTANVTTNGAVTTVTFSYGLTASYTNTATTTVPDPAVALPTPVALTNLIGNQTYHFQVVATNSAGTSVATADQTFFEPAYAGAPTTGAATTVAGTATLNGKVTGNGTPGKAHFEYGLTTAYGMTTSPDVTVGADAIGQTIQGTASGLTRDTTYHFRLVFVDDATLTPVNGADAQFLTNNAPIAKTDTVNAAGTGPTTINPLVNDRDPDGDAISLVDVATDPQQGTALVSGNSIIYTPNGASTGFDTFTYTMEDVYGLTAEGTINIRAVRAAFAGTHGGFIKKANGKEAGYFTVTATSLGTFTGIAIIDGKRFIVSGSITPEGVYRGWATKGGSAIPVFIFTDQNDSGSVVTALFDNGRWSSELTLSPEDRTTRPALLGRYTAGIGAGGSGPTNGNDPGTPPEGSGWLAIRVSDDATAAIKGRISDGRSFSTRGTVNILDGVPTLTFYDDPEATRFIGQVTLGDTVGGTTRTDRHTSGEGLYPRGYDITQTIDGARYIPPVPGKRVLDTDISKGQDLTISFSGGSLGGTLSRELYLDDRDKVKVLNSGAEELKVKIDRKSGRFQAKVTIDTDGTRVKATGVLVQSPSVTTTDATTGVVTTTGGTGGSGIGAFNTSKGTGTVTISAAGSGGSTTTSAGTTVP